MFDCIGKKLRKTSGGGGGGGIYIPLVHPRVKSIISQVSRHTTAVACKNGRMVTNLEVTTAGSSPWRVQQF